MYESYVKVQDEFEVYLKNVKSEASIKELSALTTDASLQEKAKLQALERLTKINNRY